MTDLIFLLLVFFVLATTLINPNNAVKLTLPSSSSTMGDPSAVSISVLSRPSGNYVYIFNGKQNNPYNDAQELATELNAYYESNMADSQKSLIVSVHCEKDNTTVDALLTIIDMINDQNKAAGDVAPGVQRYKMVLATDKK